jgi:hypothetical protein
MPSFRGTDERMPGLGRAKNKLTSVISIARLGPKALLILGAFAKTTQISDASDIALPSGQTMPLADWQSASRDVNQFVSLTRRGSSTTLRL